MLRCDTPSNTSSIPHQRARAPGGESGAARHGNGCSRPLLKLNHTEAQQFPLLLSTRLEMERGALRGDGADATAASCQSALCPLHSSCYGTHLAQNGAAGQCATSPLQGNGHNGWDLHRGAPRSSGLTVPSYVGSASAASRAAHCSCGSASDTACPG